MPIPFTPDETAAFRKAECAFLRNLFPTAAPADFEGWRWQLAHAATTPDRLREALPDLSPREARALDNPAAWRMPLRIPPYLLFLLSRTAPDSPLRRTLLPDLREARPDPLLLADPLGELTHLVAPRLLCAYPHKALLLATPACAAACRYCTRAHLTAAPEASPLLAPPPDAATSPANPADPLAPFRPALDWLAQHPEINDLLLSGGDPLLLPDETLDRLLAAVRRIPHVRLIRIGTKIPAALPHRITPSLLRILSRHRPLWLSTHFTLPAEITPRSAAACIRLSERGIPLMNQCVLLRRVNDDPTTLAALLQTLLLINVKPYYLHQTDCAAGTAHFRVPVSRGRALVRALHGPLPGYAVPHYMSDPPPGGHKHPL